MTTELQTRLRKELETERAAIVDELQSHGADPYSERVAPLAGVDEGFADAAAATAERHGTLALIEAARQRLRDVDEALGRMDAGTYGVCVDCGQPIPEARLEARPLSVRCVDCAAAPRDHGRVA